MKTKTKETNKRFEPKMESKTSMSKDGKWLIHKTIFTSFTHINYLNKVVGGKK